MAGVVISDASPLIGLARQRQLIPSARAVLSQLHDSDFRIASAVIHAVLRRCGESSPEWAKQP
ncbi:MAG: DUF3368 domain-containing protein [Synechococcus sp.]|jgi:predicted nucleic acid-binding protein|nr:DUF3368 domain-containing protein [Synechococcus sp.]